MFVNILTFHFSSLHRCLVVIQIKLHKIHFCVMMSKTGTLKIIEISVTIRKEKTDEKETPLSLVHDDHHRPNHFLYGEVR